MKERERARAIGERLEEMDEQAKSLLESASTHCRECGGPFNHRDRQLALQGLADALKEYVEMDDPKGEDWTPTHAYEIARAALKAAQPFLEEK